jgi:hypothetical protein
MYERPRINQDVVAAYNGFGVEIQLELECEFE